MSRAGKVIKDYGLQRKTLPTRTNPNPLKYQSPKKVVVNTFTIDDFYDFREAFGLTEKVTKAEREIYRNITLKLNIDEEKLELMGDPDITIEKIVEKIKNDIGEKEVLELGGVEYKMMKLFSKETALKRVTQIWKQELVRVGEKLQKIDATEFKRKLEEARKEDLESSLSEVEKYYGNLFGKRRT